MLWTLVCGWLCSAYFSSGGSVEWGRRGRSEETSGASLCRATGRSSGAGPAPLELVEPVSAETLAGAMVPGLLLTKQWSPSVLSHNKEQWYRSAFLELVEPGSAKPSSGAVAGQLD